MAKTTKSQPALMVDMGNGWEYVFSHTNGSIVTTEDRSKALGPGYPGYQDRPNSNWNFFRNNFGNYEFKVEKGSRSNPSREEDIVFETDDNKFYVYRIGKGDYEVRENGATHAVKRGTFYFKHDDAMAKRRAIEHAKKLADARDYRHNPRKTRRNPDNYRVVILEEEGGKYYPAGTYFYRDEESARKAATNYLTEGEEGTSVVVSRGDSLIAHGGSISQYDAMRHGTGTVNRLTHNDSKGKRIVSKYNPPKTRRNPDSIFEKAWAVYSEVEAYYLDRAEMGKRFPEDVRADSHALWLAEQSNDESFARKIIEKYKNFFSKNPRKTRKNGWSLRGNKAQLKAGIRGIRDMMRGMKTSSPRYKTLKQRLRGYQKSLLAYRSTKRNEGEAAPAKTKISTKTILGVGVAVVAFYYLLRKRASAAAATPTFQTPPASPINSSTIAVRVGQRYADVAKLLTQYRIPFRIVRQDGRALSVTKDRNPSRWNLSVNRGIIVSAYRG